jgi:cyclophilin family peptidyl-prolyl cis-trans isomerase
VRKAALLPLLLLILVVAGCGNSSDDETGAETQAQTESSAAGAPECTEADVPPAREDGGATAPTERLDPEKTYNLVVKTNCGTFTITLDQATSPATTASLVSLANDGFYDDTIFHRIVPGFVIQGGDPTQTGGGGPGYSTVDVPPADAAYPKGVVAMANGAQDPPGTAESQFFVVTGDTYGFDPLYAVVGNVTSGLDVVELIGTLGDPETDRPTQPVVVESVTVEEQ